VYNVQSSVKVDGGEFDPFAALSYLTDLDFRLGTFFVITHPIDITLQFLIDTTLMLLSGHMSAQRLPNF
jgi:hypothetical protein